MKIKFKKIVDLFVNIKNNYPVTLLFTVGNFINAIVLRLFTTGSFGIRALFFDFTFVMIMTGISFLIKKRNRTVYYFLATLFMVAICIINSIYYNYYESFVSASLLATSVFVKDVGDAVVDFALKATDWIYLWIFIGLFLVVKKTDNSFNASRKKANKIFLVSLISLAIGCALPPYYSFSRFIKLWNRVSVVNTSGVYIYQIDDLVQSLKPTFNNIFGYDEALKNTKEYYEKNTRIQTKNEYSSIFEGKNVIVIHAESLQSFTLGLSFEGKEVTPNINKLVNSGIYFSNFYAQVGVGTSSDSEFTYASSLLPANNGTVFVNYFNDKFETVQHLLNDKGYYVFSMHGNVGDFWNRETMHMNMGYDKFYSKSSFVIDEEYGLGLSDKSFFRQVVPMIGDINKNVGTPYYGTLITLTNHTPWRDANKFSKFMTTKTVNIDGKVVVRDYLEGTTMGNYIKSVNYMDEAIGNFINDMDNAGLLDNTVIVIYGDHDARISKQQYDYMYNYDPVSDRVLEEGDEGYIEFNEYDYELNKSVPFIIWTKDMKKATLVDTPMGMIDVGPTLGNMLGIYNKYALGQDVMSIKKDEGIVVFKDGSYITDKMYYSAKNNEAYTLSSGVIPDNYIEEKSDYADKIIEVSDNIITYDLIKDLE